MASARFGLAVAMNHGRAASRRVTCGFEMLASADVVPSGDLPTLHAIGAVVRLSTRTKV
jgi:hypothetical protein